MITEILLGLILASNIVIIWLLFKILPTEKQKEVLRKIQPIEGEVIEWNPPEDATAEASRKVKKDLGIT